MIATDFATVLGDRNGPLVSTAEHVLAALRGMGVDNAIIEIDGPEVPIMDGSAAAFVAAIDQAGIVTQPAQRRFVQVLKPISVKIGDYQIASKEEFPWRDTWPFVALLKERFGVERMMWGTGYPRTARLVPLEQALRDVEEDLPLSDDERRQLLWDTPKALFDF